MEKKSRSGYLAKNILIFTIGNIGTKLIAFFLVPLYTAVLITSEYGTIDLITTISTIAVPIITLNICESVMRFALDKNADHNKITQIGTYILVLGSVVGLILIPICNLYQQVSEYSLLSYFFVITSASSQLYLCDLRGKEKLTYYSIGSILNTLLVALCNILFLVVLKVGIVGYFWAYIIANSITALYAIVIGKGYKSFLISRIDKKLLKDMIKYSVVLIPNSFMWWIMNSSDRIMVTGMISIAANGIYAISYKLPTLVTTLTSIFNQAWSYSAIKEEGSEDEEEYNNRVFKVLISTVMMIGVTVIAFSKPFLKIYVAESYYSAWQYIPFLTVGCVYLTLGTFMATSYTVHKDSFGYLFSGMFGAILNIILNFILIPVIGVYGAALATGVSYIAVFAFRLFHTRKYITYRVKNKEFLFGSLALLFVSSLVYVDSFWALLTQIVVVIFSALFYSSTWLPIMKGIIVKIKNRGRTNV